MRFSLRKPVKFQNALVHHFPGFQPEESFPHRLPVPAFHSQFFLSGSHTFQVLLKVFPEPYFLLLEEPVRQNPVPDFLPF